MRHHRIPASAAAVLLSLCSVSFARGHCSLQTVRGSWGWQSHGTAMMTVGGNQVPVPYASLGIMKIDDEGAYAGYGTMSVGGQVVDVPPFGGSLQVNPDCTGTDSFGLAQVAGRFVILDHGNEIQGMPLVHALGPVAGTLVLRRIAWGEARCGPHMVRGLYGGLREGIQTVLPPGQSQPVTVPFSAVHTAAFRDGGAGTATSTASMGGAILEFQFPSVSITVNSDCTATMRYTAISAQFPGLSFTATVNYIVLDYGDELMGMDTMASLGLPGVVRDNLKRISIAPATPGM